MADEYDKPEIHIITDDRMTELKKKALCLLGVLPEELTEALIVLRFMTSSIESVTGKTIEKYNIIIK